MSDLVIISAAGSGEAGDVARLIGASDLSARHHVESSRADDVAFAVSSRVDAPTSGPRSHRNGNWTVVFAGDLVDHEAVPFAEIIGALVSGDFNVFADFEGVFAIAAYNDANATMYAVTDRRAQKPIFYRTQPDGVLFATTLACFVRGRGGPVFNRTWFWQLLYFNIPVDDTTFLDGVTRLPAATVMSVDTRSGEQVTAEYAEPFRAETPLSTGDEALDRIATVFGARVRAHYQGADRVACALTNGWDGRTLLAMAPAGKDVTAYTYGGPGCADLHGASATAQSIGVNHQVIPFDRDFSADLPRHALETVYLSGGLQGVLRATLHHVYDSLTDGGLRFPLTISGISLGTQLRGAAQYPDLISMDLAMRFQGMAETGSESHREVLFDNEQAAFDDHIRDRLEWLEQRFGPLENGETHLAYTVYPASANYFCGELAVADHFTTVRVPAWDSNLIRLNFATEYSTMSFSHFVRRSRKVERKELELQAYLIRRYSRSLYRIPVRGIHPAAVLAGEIPYQAERMYRFLGRQVAGRLSSAGTAPLENWNAWLFDDNPDFVNGLLRSRETRIGDYVRPDVVGRVIETRNIRLLGKLLTTEIILRLLRTGWQRFW